MLLKRFVIILPISILVMDTDSNNKLVSELLHANGIPIRVPAEGETAQYPEVTLLEMFFFGAPVMYGYHLFPNLTHLYIVNQNVKKIECLKSCTNLRELWICETAVEKIEGLEQCKKLQHLYLYANVIARIENIQQLTKLKTLSLADNAISKIEGLQSLKELLGLNLANNNISNIGESLDGNVSLVSLNISGNPIIHFDTLSILKNAAFLTSLSLADPQYKQCPLAKMRNYTTLLLFHFPHLKYFDNFPVTDKLVKTAKEIISNKKLYYKLKMRKVCEDFRVFRHDLLQVEQTVLARCYNLRHGVVADMGVLESLEDDVTREIFEADFDNALLSINVNNNKDNLDVLLTSISGVLDRLYSDCQRSVKCVTDTCQLFLTRLDLEYSTAGNIEFIPGSPDCEWYRACVDLLASSPPDKAYQFGIRGLTVQSVHQVKNPSLHARFEQKVLSICGKIQRTRSDPNPHNNILSTVDYLFLQSSTDIDQSRTQSFLSTEGLPLLQTGKETNCFLLTHSVYEADIQRLASNANSAHTDDIRHGYAILCKVFLGRSKLISSLTDAKQINFSQYNSAIVSKFADKDNPQDFIPDCHCDDQRIFLIPDRDLIVPEYLITFDYKMNVDTTELIHIDRQAVMSCISSTSTSPLHISTNEVLLNKIHSPLSNSVFPTPIHLHAVLHSATNYNTLTTVYLPACGLESIQCFNQFPNLTALCVASNRISSISELNAANLKYLDASHNVIRTIDGLKPHAIVTFDISWNMITDLATTLASLKASTPSLLDLSLYMNPFSGATQSFYLLATSICTSNWVILETFVYFPDLRNFNSTPASEFTQITSFIFKENKPQLTPDCVSTADTTTDLTLYKYQTTNKNSSLTTQDYKWHLAVTTLKLQGRGVQALPINFNLPNLKFADFSHNQLTSLHSLSNCVNLLELNLDSNLLANLQGIDNLTNLEELSCSDNKICSLPRLASKHFNLVSLILNHNLITSLQHSNAYISLQDLSLIANPIHSLREILHLKHNSSLIALNISDISVLRKDNDIRYFCFFHLPNIRCFNNELVKTSELILAREMYGGKLALSTISERVGHSNFSSIRELSLVNQSIRSFDLDPIESLDNLRSLNLENNQLTSLQGLLELNKLRILCVNNNKITSLYSVHNDDQYPVLTNLHVIQLASNNITKLGPLQLHRMPSLKAIFLQNNDINSLEGLEEFPSLIELVLDRNKLKYIAEKDLGSLKNILELHLEENRLRFLPDLTALVSLHKLFLGNNRISDLKEVVKLTDLTFLIEVSFINNPISRKANYSMSIIQAVPNIKVIDRCDIPCEERARALDELSTQWNPM